tara:strand:- start:34 stop:609 length:576 start_codon:yes stop_codon:yes gene_type:complete
MKLLREYIRELLAESIDPNIISQIDKIEKLGLKIELFTGAKYGSVTVFDGHDIIGGVDWENPEGGKCNGAEMVSSSGMSLGLGPLLYDVAIEASQGLMSDRMEVSAEAEAVWQRYMTSRPDIEVIQLDINKDYQLPQLTPDNEYDDCEQVPAYDMHKEDWHTSPLSKMYKKSGTPVIDELRSRGILKDHGR